MTKYLIAVMLRVESDEAVKGGPVQTPHPTAQPTLILKPPRLVEQALRTRQE